MDIFKFQSNKKHGDFGFTDVPLRDDQGEYLCKVADRANPMTRSATRDTLLCR
ncbi:hypothetical protein HHK36_011060 [Tetracentron sinense]|uniref:Uncharacterized protein n=1 Tax=Tetracentron sinense TaxID=13715 RepID=A0A834ZI02_TETSI|nr:hypothetical protein HHK36_011060 [Tetracentron sinense]